MKRKIKIGNDGYGDKNITVTKHEYGVIITQTDPHNWNKVNSVMTIPNRDLDKLIEFLTEVKEHNKVKH